MPFDFKAVFERALPYQAYLKKHGTAEHQERWAKMYDQVVLTDAQRALLGSFRRKMPVLCMSGTWCGDCVNGCTIFQRIAEAAPSTIDLRFVNRSQKFDPTPPAPVASKAAVAGSDADDIRARPLGKILVRWGILAEHHVEKAYLHQQEQKAKGMNVRIGDVLTGMGVLSEADRDRALAHQAGFGSLDDADRQVAIELSICGGARVPVLVFLSEDWYECQRYGERTLSTYRTKVSQLQGASCPTGLMAPPQDLLSANIAEWLTSFERIQWMLLTSPRLMKLHGEI